MEPQPIKPVLSDDHRPQNLREELKEARRELAEAEAALAEEQAAVNRFRLHCRLMLDDLVEALDELKEEKQALLTEYELLRQEAGEEADQDPFWGAQELEGEEIADEDLPTPTPVPRDKAAEKRLYRELARRFHPDTATSPVERAYMTSIMAAVNEAYASGDTQSLFDLAGEPDPEEIALLTTIKAPEARKLRTQVLKVQRRRRVVLQRHRMLRADKTAILWRKSQELEESGVDWWEPVRRELIQAIDQRRETIATLRQRITQMEARQRAETESLSDE